MATNTNVFAYRVWFFHPHKYPPFTMISHSLWHLQFFIWASPLWRRQSQTSARQQRYSTLNFFFTYMHHAPQLVVQYRIPLFQIDIEKLKQTSKQKIVSGWEWARVRWSRNGNCVLRYGCNFVLHDAKFSSASPLGSGGSKVLIKCVHLKTEISLLQMVETVLKWYLSL